jgi:hypothetical protein
MPIRWVINPVVETTVGGTTYRRSKVATLVDPGRTGPGGTPKTYKHSTIIAGAAWCLSFVRGTTMTTLDADTDCIHLFEQDYEDADDITASTVADLGWNAAKITRVRNRLEAKGVDTSGYTGATPLWQIARDLARALIPSFTRAQLAETRTA